MPHQCTNCGRTFPDGSKEMLSGCPDCGGHKFQFRPSSSVDEDATPAAGDFGGSAAADADAADAGTEPADAGAEAANADPADAGAEAANAGADAANAGAADGTDGPEAGVAGVGADAADTGPAGTPTDAGTDAAGTPAESGTPTDAGDGEDRAQRDARSEVVGPDELPPRKRASEPPDADGTVIEPDDDDRPDIDELRQELNDQFESIRIVSPGTYELNLMELYDRDEYIISLQEDGRYVIEVPDSWRRGDDEE